MSVKAFNASLSLALALSVCLSGCGLGARTAPDDGPATQTKSQSNTRSPREEPSARPSPETPPAQDQTPTVTFDANGGESDTGARDVTYDAEYGELPQPTRLGYDFEGWYTQKEGGEKIGGSTHVAIGK
ncbi:MAG: InlB B-repeat-containing protein, partial [Bifidobacteriaceae bacterium]|nr:InlB B-repeat-containing protein [Bifidobacteriaceae bacterium]